jgi:glutathione S-transferase
MQKLELVSFDVCPYVQRSVITLKHKKVDFKLTFIDLESPPEWFNKISPMGKVPVLLVRENGGGEPVVLFESAVINEYLDETTPPSVQPQDALQRAREKAWVAVAGDILGNLFSWMTSEGDEAKEVASDIWGVLARVEDTLPGGRYFSKRGFSLVDAAFAPAFMRMLMMRSVRDDSRWQKLPKTLAWANALLELPEVRDSVIPEFRKRYIEVLKKYGSPLADDVA